MNYAASQTSARLARSPFAPTKTAAFKVRPRPPFTPFLCHQTHFQLHAEFLADLQSCLHSSSSLDRPGDRHGRHNAGEGPRGQTIVAQLKSGP